MMEYLPLTRANRKAASLRNDKCELSTAHPADGLFGVSMVDVPRW
jgi:hypothetical protein